MTTAIIARADLRPALALLNDIVPRRNSVPIFGNALVQAHPEGGAMLRTTDEDRQVTVRIPGASVDGAFATTIPVAILKTVEGKAPATEHVAIDSYADANSLDFEGLRVKVGGLPAAEFPEMEVVGEIHAEFVIPSSALRAGLEAVEFAMSTEETRYYLCGVYMHPIPGDEVEGLRLVATDGHRLAMHDMPMAGVGKDWGCIIPSGTVSFLIKMLKAKGAAAETHVLVNTVKAAITVGNVNVVTALVEGTYPDYGRVIPRTSNTTACVDRKAMIGAIKAVSALASERGRGTRLEVGGGAVRLVVNNPDLGNAEMDVPAAVTGDELSIGFNSDYLLDILNAIGDAQVEVHMQDAGAPAVVRARGAASSYVLMPMRV